MRIYSFQLIQFLFLLLAGCTKNPLPVQGGFVVGPTAHEFSPSRQNEELYHIFILTNEAEVPLLITGLESSCGCTWAADKDSFVGSIYSIEDFPDGTDPSDEGTTSEVMENCYQETRCRQTSGDATQCETAPTLPYVQAAKVSVGEGTCPSEQ
ncbi:MAG: DUF1573 domain-containing protein [Planctomycetaceae bacterium]|nr:DUF1573 domain-containing protein [Planctomycetaceae bacterium]